MLPLETPLEFPRLRLAPASLLGVIRVCARLCQQNIKALGQSALVRLATIPGALVVEFVSAWFEMSPFAWR